jgi:hypothetical protein
MIKKSANNASAASMVVSMTTTALGRWLDSLRNSLCGAEGALRQVGQIKLLKTRKDVGPAGPTTKKISNCFHLLFPAGART